MCSPFNGTSWGRSGPVIHKVGIYPPTQKATVFETVGECVEGTLRSSYERSGVCFGGFRPTKHVEESRLRAVTHFGVQARASARGGSTLPLPVLLLMITSLCSKGDGGILLASK